MNKYDIIITGKNPDYFIKKLISKKVHIYYLEKIDHKNIKILIDQDSLEIIDKIKTSYKYRIVNTHGIIKVKYLIKKYFIFLLGIVLSVIINIFLSKRIFFIEIRHENKFIRELISNDLKYYGIKKYNRKLSFYEKQKIIKKILKKETNYLEWLEIEEIGTKYIIHVEQRKLNKEEKDCSKQNIVAKKDAMILDIYAESGEVLKKKLDYVKKGDVIISGEIHNKEEIVNRRCAKGTVYGEVWYKVEVELPEFYKEEFVTGREKYKLEITLFNKNYTLNNHFSSYKRNSTKLITSNLFPISVNFTKYLETKITIKKYNFNNVDKDSLKMASEKLKTKLEKEDIILSKKVLKKAEKKSKIIIEVFFKVRENITDTADIIEIKE